MSVLVDTTIWSLALRRRRGDLSSREKEITLHFRDLIRSGHVVLLGAVRQELLSGIDNSVAFERIRDQLGSFPNEPLDEADYEEAARCANRLLAKGFAQTAIDCLICGVALNRKIPVFTTDKNFIRYRDVLSVQLHVPPSADQN